MCCLFSSRKTVRVSHCWDSHWLDTERFTNEINSKLIELHYLSGW